MNIKLSIVRSDVLLIEIEGELDLVVAEEFKKSVEDAIYSKNLKYLVIDFHKLNFIDSSGLGVILGRYKTIQLRNGSIFIIGSQPSVKKILEMSGIMRVIHLEDDLNSVLKVI